MRYWQEPLLHELTEACERLATTIGPTVAEARWEGLAAQLEESQSRQPEELERVDKIRRMLKEWHAKLPEGNQ